MSAAAIRDAVADRIAGLPSARYVYGNGSTAGAKAAEWPAKLTDDGPHALVGRGASGRTGGTGNQFVARGIAVEWRFSARARAEAELLMDRLEDEIVTAFSAGITLGGLAIDCVYVGSERPFDVVDGEGATWVSWLTHFAARERFAVEMSA